MSKKVDPAKQKKIDGIIELRNKEIRNVLSGKSNQDVISSKGKNVIQNAMSTTIKVLFILISIILFIGMYVLHGILKISDTTNSMFKYSFKLFLFLIPCSAIAVLLHMQLLNMAVSTKNLGRASTALSGLAPVIATLLILRSYPEITAPIDNTIGYFITKATTSANDNPMTSFDSAIFPKDALKKFGDNVIIPFDWLLTTFDLNRARTDSILDSLEKTTDIKSHVTKTGIVPDFYVNLSKDTDEYLKFKSNLFDMIESKHSVGHFIVTMFSFIAGISMSLGMAIRAK